MGVVQNWCLTPLANRYWCDALWSVVFRNKSHGDTFVATTISQEITWCIANKAQYRLSEPRREIIFLNNSMHSCYDCMKIFEFAYNLRKTPINLGLSGHKIMQIKRSWRGHEINLIRLHLCAISVIPVLLACCGRGLQHSSDLLGMFICTCVNVCALPPSCTRQRHEHTCVLFSLSLSRSPF